MSGRGIQECETGHLAPKRTYLTVIGDANNPATWSGIPFHLLEAGREAGIIDEGLNLSVNSRVWKLRRAVWNAGTLMRCRRYGGFQYSEWFLEKLYAPFQSKLAGSRVINCFQLYSPSVTNDGTIEKWFYIDMTLRQLFDFDPASIDRRTKAEVLERERLGYLSAEGVITHSRWAAESIIRDYGVASNRVHTVVPGANLDPATYAAWESNRQATVQAAGHLPLRLVFVGKDSKRKGLDRLLDAFQRARTQGAAITLRIIGCGPELMPMALRSLNGVEWCGFINKRTEAATFVKLVAESDIGCLFSRAEAGGICLREFHALGLVAMGPAVGGAPEHMIPGACIPISVAATPAEIADILVSLSRDPASLEKMRAVSLKARHTALWDASVAEIRTMISTAERRAEL